MLDNYCINWWNNTSVNSIFDYDSENIVLFSKEISFSTGSNGVNIENKRCTKIA
jgi:hypothetical protein